MRAAAKRAKAAPPAQADDGGASDAEGGGSGALLASQRAHLRVSDSFLPAALARSLRGAFEQHFAEPRVTRAEDFCWNYWSAALHAPAAGCTRRRADSPPRPPRRHVPGQYTLLRTPAQDFFDPKLFRRAPLRSDAARRQLAPDAACHVACCSKLEEALLSYGREALGCAGISPIWLSYYVSGCRQELHADVPHGPWAFVLSLTPEQRTFTGGETMVLQPHVLDYFRDFDPSRVVEAPQLLELVAPEFNRLTVFDARFPHGVRVVEGVSAPTAARVVLHGWFTPPAPFFEGGLGEEEAREALEAALEPLYRELEQLPPALGILTVRLRIKRRGGAPADVTPLSDTLVPVPPADSDARAQLLEAVQRNLDAARFPAAAKDTRITLPFVFE